VTTAASVGLGAALQEAAVRCRDLERSLAFYVEGLGLEPLGRGSGWATVGVGGAPLVRLGEDRAAVPPPPGATGLYHFAIHLPRRSDLAQFVRHALRLRLPIVGFGDHEVSEAVYLVDPDGHGIELYHDRPRALWEGRVAELMTTKMVDLAGLLAEAGEERPWHAPAGTRMGHFHLKVADVSEAVEFYRALLDLELTARLGRSAAFLSWGGYHHHLGLNSWESAGGRPPAERALALIGVVVALPAQELELVGARLADPGREPLRGAQLPGGRQPDLAFADPSANRWFLFAREPLEGVGGGG